MARASTDPTAARAAVFSRTTLMTLRRVLHAYREGWLLDERLAAGARMVAADARRAGLPAAQMLVALKAAWETLDEVRRLPMLDARELLDRLVSLGIRAYFAGSPRRLRDDRVRGAA
jgi:hypothetical protein